ncbi:hypothetical protein LCGC14_1613900 [marine sediment metagenome]|uniref:Uncharacterized protein n=1 Tax=marine sediment metagenome TaxID=412755 RepID=A0A0F9I7S1_9ZZZZ
MPLYQKLAPKIKELKALGMTINEITNNLRINKKKNQKKPK